MNQLIIDIAAILAAATPLIFATMGETISERAGVVNLSLDGSMLLAAMIGFAVALTTGSLLVGFAAAAMTGAIVALILGGLSLSLGQSQTAVGFVLALLCTDLSSFLGARYVRVPGPAVPHTPIPVLSDIPLIGTLFFNHDPLIYSSLILIPLVWWFLFHTRTGLVLRALGDRPQTVYARGVPVVRLRYLYLIIGGALIGIAGAAYSLDLKQGWSYRHTFGMGWIALAIVIFGGWQPWRVAIGCYLFAALQVMASRSQSIMPGLPTQIFQVAPFVLMIVVLALVNLLSSPNTVRRLNRLPEPMRRPAERIVAWLATPAPMALGQRFERP